MAFTISRSLFTLIWKPAKYLKKPRYAELVICFRGRSQATQLSVHSPKPVRPFHSETFALSTSIFSLLRVLPYPGGANILFDLYSPAGGYLSPLFKKVGYEQFEVFDCLYLFHVFLVFCVF